MSLRDKKVFGRKIGVTRKVYAQSPQTGLITWRGDVGHMDFTTLELIQFFHGHLGSGIAVGTYAEGDEG